MVGWPSLGPHSAVACLAAGRLISQSLRAWAIWKGIHFTCCCSHAVAVAVGGLGTARIFQSDFHSILANIGHKKLHSDFKSVPLLIKNINMSICCNWLKVSSKAAENNGLITLIRAQIGVVQPKWRQRTSSPGSQAQMGKFGGHVLQEGYSYRPIMCAILTTTHYLHGKGIVRTGLSQQENMCKITFWIPGIYIWTLEGYKASSCDVYLGIPYITAFSGSIECISEQEHLSWNNRLTLCKNG